MFDTQPSHSVVVSGTISRFAIQLRMLLEPRQLMTMSWFVLSTAIKPVTSVLGEFSNLRIMSVSAASTRLQSPPGQVTLAADPL